MEFSHHHALFKQGRLAESLAEHWVLMAAIEARAFHWRLQEVS